jgi:hypothetical protein
MLDFNAEILRQIDISSDKSSKIEPGDAIYLRSAPQSFGKVVGFVRLNDQGKAIDLFGVVETVYHKTTMGQTKAPPTQIKRPASWRCRQVPYTQEVFSEPSSTRVRGWISHHKWEGKGEMVLVKHFLKRGHRLRVHHEYHLMRFHRTLYWELRRLDMMHERSKLAEGLYSG